MYKKITGDLKVKYNHYSSFGDPPDFAFIEGYYVPEYILRKYNITDDCRVQTTIICAGSKWKVIEIQTI